MDLIDLSLKKKGGGRAGGEGGNDNLDNDSELIDAIIILSHGLRNHSYGATAGRP